MTVVSCELKRQGQKKPHNSKMIRQYNGNNKAIRQTMDHGKLKIEHSEPTKTGSVKFSRRVCTIYTSRVTHAKSHVICYITWRKSFNKINDYKKKNFTCMTHFFKLVLSFVISLCFLIFSFVFEKKLEQITNHLWNWKSSGIL
jgi:hypothetical protein